MTVAQWFAAAGVLAGPLLGVVLVRSTSQRRPLPRWVYPLTVIAAVLIGIVCWLQPNPWTPLEVVVGLLAVPIAVVDLLEHRIPNVLSLPAAATAAITAISIGIIGGMAPTALQAVAGGAAYAAVLGLFYLFSGSLGPGDLKLALSLGTVTAAGGSSSWFMGIIAGLTLTAVVGGVGLATGRLTRTTAVPLAPGMVLGAILATSISAP